MVDHKERLTAEMIAEQNTIIEDIKKVAREEQAKIDKCVREEGQRPGVKSPPKGMEKDGSGPRKDSMPRKHNGTQGDRKSQVHGNFPKG